MSHMGRPPKPIDTACYSGRFAARLRTLREKAGLTGEEVATAISDAGYHCPSRTWYGWEQARAEPPLDALPPIAAALKVSIRILLPTK